MSCDELSCCFTGYRPQKLPFKTTKDKNGFYDSGYIDFENKLISKILSLVDAGCTEFISGMAMGFDIIAAECVIAVRDIYNKSSIKLICAVPFIEQSESYPDIWKQKYDFLLSNSDEVILTSDKYYPSCYMKRNKYMVDNSDMVLTFYDGKPGGTKNTVDYAVKKGRKIINLYENKVP